MASHSAVPEYPCIQVACLGSFWMPTGVPLSAQEVLENLKDRWYQADNPPSDLLLTEDEFLSFLHPEHSRGMLKFMVKEIVRDLGESSPGRGGGVCCPHPTDPLGGRSAWAGPGLGGLRRLCGHLTRDGQSLPGAVWPQPGSRQVL